MHQNSSKNGKWFLILFNFGWMVDLAMSIFEFLTKFLIFWHPCWKWNLKRATFSIYILATISKFCPKTLRHFCLLNQYNFYWNALIFDTLICQKQISNFSLKPKTNENIFLFLKVVKSKKRMQIILSDDKCSLIIMIMSHYSLSLTYFSG